MPELPDLQVFSSNLHKLFRGKTVSRIKIPVTKKLKTAASAFQKTLAGQKLKKIYRDGKELHFAFSKGDILGLHLMLHGDMKTFEGKNLHRHTILEIQFTDGSGLALTDWQRSATPTLNPEEKEAPDALDAAVNYRFLKDALQRKAIVKNILLDQEVLRGIGNAYADEILWESRISPFAAGNSIPDAAIRRLAGAIRKVLTRAEKQISKTNPGLINGEVREFMKIHNARKKTSPTGAVIKHRVVGGRKTYYTEEQQG